MSNVLLFLIVLLLSLGSVYADDGVLRNDMFNTLPDSDIATFRTNSRTVWDHENAQREARFLGPFVVSGGLHGTSSTLTTAAFPTEAFVPERINQTVTAITYVAVASDTCWLIISADNDGITGWNREETTAYYHRCAASTTQPTLPPNSAWLLQVAISAASTISAVTDERYWMVTSAQTISTALTTSQKAVWDVKPGGSVTVDTATINFFGELRGLTTQQIIILSGTGSFLFGQGHSTLPIHIGWWGALPNGIDAGPGLRRAAAALVNSRGTLTALSGTYVVQQASGDNANAGMNLHGIHIVGQGCGRSLDAGVYSARTGTLFQPGANNVVMFRLTGMYGGISNLCVVNPNSYTNVSGIRLASQGTEAEGEAQTTARIDVEFNSIHDISIRDVAEGITLRPGPTIAGADSYVFHNYFDNIEIGGVTRGIFLRAPATQPGTGPNANFWRNIRVGESGCNTGIQIDAGAENVWTGISVEGCNSGTSPNATPTALLIAANSPSYNTNSNRFFGFRFESNTRDLDNSNESTELYGSWNLSTVAGTQAPGVRIGWLTDRVVANWANRLNIAENAPATPSANALYGNTMVKAWANFDGRDASFTIFTAVNCTVVRTGAGAYTVTMTTGMLNANSYVVSGSADADTIRVVGGTMAATTFQLTTGSGNDAVRIQFIVVGQQT